MADRKKIKDLSGQRSKLIQSLLDRLESKIEAAQRDLLKTVINDFLDGMEIDENGNFKNTIGNKRRLQMFDKIYSRFAQSSGLEVVQGIAEGVGSVLNFNEKYFSNFAGPAQIAPIHAQATETLSAWLGLTTRGNVAENGYLDTLIKDATVKNQIANMTMKSVVSQAGYFETKKALQIHIEGNADKAGALQRYYRNYAFDVFSVSDRTNAKVFADKLKFNYAVYEGGLVEKSREFCIKRNGKVFSREEIAEMMPTEAVPPGYDPFTDMGGYACRHHWNWIPNQIAFSMRPELKKKAPKE